MNANNPDITRSHLAPILESKNAPTTNGEQDPDSTRGYESGPAAAAVQRIPGFAILSELGRGGMAVVYQATQLALHRTVALKTMIRADAVSRARFLAEAEAVAAIRHPHVVQVFDFGEHDGTPFLAMEYVSGGTLRDALTAPLAPHDAAALLEKIASGVAAVHALGIVHRDLKPANILINAECGMRNAESTAENATDRHSALRIPNSALEPKVADFGLAKRSTGSELTQTQTIMGTPAYMAPEQAKGAKFAGPPADVWALGAILYECLTGSRPFPGEDVESILHEVLSGEPIPPRRRVPAVPRDLERVCLKCLEKKPGDRYASAKELADDLGRFLAGRPVLARPLSAPARAARWARRNPTSAVLVGLVCAVSFGLAGSLVVNYRRAVAQAAVERAAKEKAERAEQLAQEELARREIAERLATEEARRATQMSGFLVGLFTLSDPLAIFGTDVVPPNYETLRNLTSRDFLDDAERKLRAGELNENPLGRARLLLVIGTSYRNLGEFGRAERLLSEALDLRRRHLPPDHADVLEVEVALGRVALDNGDFFAAEERFARVLDIQTRTGAEPKLVAFTRSFLAWAMAMLGRPTAVAVLRECIAERERVFGPTHRETLFIRMGLVAHLLDHGRTLEAIPELQLVVEGLRTQPDGQTRALAEVLQTFQEGVVQWQLASSFPSPLDVGKRKQAAATLERSLALAQQALPKYHIYIGLIHFQIGAVYETLDDDARAEVEYRFALEVVHKTCGLAHPKVLVLVEHYTELLHRTKRPWLARLLFLEMSNANRDRFGTENYWRFPLLIARAQFESDAGDDARAAVYARQALTLARTRPPIASRILATNVRELAWSMDWGAHGEVCHDLFALARTLAAAAYGDPSPELCIAIRGQGLTLYRQKQRAAGAANIREAGAMAERLGTQPLPKGDAVGLARSLGMIEAHRGNFPEAERHYRRALALVRAGYRRTDPLLADVQFDLASVLADRGAFAEAADLCEEAHPTVAARMKPTDTAYSHLRVALLRIASGDRERMQAALARCAAAAPKESDVLAFSYLARAWAYAPDDLEGWDHAAAARKLAAGVQTRPSFVAPHRALALSWMRCGNRTEAEAAIHRFGGPQTAMDHLIVAWIAARDGDVTTAREHLAAADKILARFRPNPENPFAYADSFWMDRVEVAMLRERIVRIVDPKN